MEPFYDSGTHLDISLAELEADHNGFTQLSNLLKQHAGINLPPTPKNFTLLSTRLRKILIKYSLYTYQSYYLLLKQHPHLIAEFISRMTTNTTHFFRENEHFIILKEILPALLKKKTQAHDFELRLWCAAASTGEEPYSIAITLLENIPNLLKWDIKLLASDIDAHVLDKAMSGVYAQTQVAPISPFVLQKYFTVNIQGQGLDRVKYYHVTSQLKDLLHFAEFNLKTELYPFNTSFDIIFCRNVFIYFDQETVLLILDKFTSHLKVGGYLFIGHSESGNIRHTNLKRISHAVYQRIP